MNILVGHLLMAPEQLPPILSYPAPVEVTVEEPEIDVSVQNPSIDTVVRQVPTLDVVIEEPVI